MAKERPLSRKARTYLAAFEAWLPTGAGRARKTEALDDLVDGILPSVEEEIASADPCPNCGGPMLRDVVSGKQRLYCCEDCSVEADEKRRGPR